MWFGEVKVQATGDYVQINEVPMVGDSYMSGAILIEKIGDYVQVSWSDGVKLKFSKDSLIAFLTVEEQYKNKVRGLCGHYTATQLNDMLLHDMMTYTTDPIEFGNSWRIDSSVSICFFYELILKYQ